MDHGLTVSRPPSNPYHATSFANAHGAATAAAPTEHQSQHKRVYQACIPCRRRKVKCQLGEDVDNPSDPPCLRCRRESKECFFSATRRKRRADEVDGHDGEDEYLGGEGGGDGEDDYVVRNGRKRAHADDSPAPARQRDRDVDVYREVPLTPGGSIGRSQPLRRPGSAGHGHGRNGSAGTISQRRPSARERDSSFAGADPNSPLENFEAKRTMQPGIHGPNDAMKMLWEAASLKENRNGTDEIPASSSRLSGLEHGTIPRISINAKRTEFSPFVDGSGGMKARKMADASIDPQLRGLSDASDADAGMVVALKAWERFRFVRARWFTAKEAVQYIEYYYAYLSPLTPISPPTFRDPATHQTLLSEEPVLAMTLLTIASRYRELPGPGGVSRAYAIHAELWTYLRGMIERVLWGQEAFGGGIATLGAGGAQTSTTEPERGIRKGSLRTLGTIGGLLILTEWHPRALHFPPAKALDELMLPSAETLQQEVNDENEDQQPAVGIGGRRIESWFEPAWRSDRMCWMLLTTAMGLGYELGVFDNVEELLQDGAITRPEYEDESYRLRAFRTKRLILIYLSQLAGRLGWTNMVPEKLRKEAALPRRRPTSVEGSTPGTTFSSQSQSFNYIPNLELDDQIIHCWAGISNAMHAGNERLFKSRKYTTDIIQSRRYIEILQGLQPMLSDWWKEFERFKLPLYIRHILTIEFEYVRIYINSLSLQAVVDRSAMAASNAGKPASSPGTQDAYGKLPLGHLGGFGPEDQEHVKEVVEGSRNLLRTVVEGLLPDGYLKHAPVRTYFRIISGAMFLLKTFALGATKSDVELSIGLMDRTVDALRSCVVDDVHLGIRFADLLDTLTTRLRNRFIHATAAGGPANGGGAASSDSRSPMPEQQQPLQGPQRASAGLSDSSRAHDVNGHDFGAKARDVRELLGGGEERSATPVTATISATPFDPASYSSLNFSSGLFSNSNSLLNASLNGTGNTFPGDFTGDGMDWSSGDMLYLAPGSAFYQSLNGEPPTMMGMNAEGVNQGGLDLLDFLATDDPLMPGDSVRQGF